MELDWNPSAPSGHVARRWRLNMDLSQPCAVFCFFSSFEQKKNGESNTWALFHPSESQYTAAGSESQNKMHEW